MAQERGTVEAIAARIADYCARSPNVADSAEGIRLWWLCDAGLRLDEVEAALALLVQRGLLDRRDLVDGSAIYLVARH